MSWIRDILETGVQTIYFEHDGALYVTNGWTYVACKRFIMPKDIATDFPPATAHEQEIVTRGIVTGEPVTRMVINVDLLKQALAGMDDQYAVLEIYPHARSDNRPNLLTLAAEDCAVALSGVDEDAFTAVSETAWRPFMKAIQPELQQTPQQEATHETP